jgi:hypothetical protein
MLEAERMPAGRAGPGSDPAEGMPHEGRRVAVELELWSSLMPMAGQVQGYTSKQNLVFTTSGGRLVPCSKISGRFGSKF